MSIMRKYFTYILILVTLLMYPLKSLAESFYGYGLGVSQSAKQSRAETKILHLGYRENLLFGIVHQLELGLWADSAGKGRSSSAFISYSLGVEVDYYGLVLRSVHGPTVISNTDAYLGGYFPQVNTEAYIGLRDKRGNSAGFMYRHISSAGIYKPNIGRDFIQIEVGLGF